MLRQVFALLAICLLSLSFVDALQIDSKDFTVDVTQSSGQPRWVFWKNDNATWAYILTFQYFFEIENVTSTSFDSVANSKFNNPNGWAITNQNFPNMTAVNWTNAGVAGMKYPNFDSIAFNSRIPLGAVANTNDTFPAGKFDIAVNGYKWSSPNSQLAFAFTFQVQATQNGLPMENFTSHGSHTANLFDSYFSINSTANGGEGLNETIDVTLKFATAFTQNSTVVDPAEIWVIFDHFDDDIYHDPEFGFGSGPGNSYIWIIIIVVVVIAIIVIILIAVIGFILVRRKRRSYDAF